MTAAFGTQYSVDGSEAAGAKPLPAPLRDDRLPPWRREGRLALIAALAVALLMVLLPFGRLVLTSLFPEGTFAPADALAEITGRAGRAALLHTLETGIVSSLGSVFIGASFSLVLALTDIPAKKLIGFLFVLSMLMAPQVTALAFMTAAGPSSPLLGAIGLAPPPGSANPFRSAGGIMVVLALHHAPLVMITVSAGLRQMPGNLVEAALIDGAGSRALLWRIVLPLLRPHLAAGALLAFVAAIGNFGIPALLGMPVNYQTLPTLIYQRLSSFGPSGIAESAALCLPLALLAGLGATLSVLLLRNRTTALEAGAPLAPFIALDRWRTPLAVLVWLVLAAGLFLPLLSLASAALTPAFGVRLTLHTLTLDKFAEVLLRQPVTLRALRNSFLYAGAAAILLGFFALPLVYALHRQAGRLRGLIEGVFDIPYALPGIVLAIACILVFLRPLPLIGVSIYGTPLIILFAYLVRFLPLALKAPLAAMAQLPADQEEAATVFGASCWQRLRHTVFPALAPAAIAGALLVFLTGFNELTVSALLWSAGTETLGVALFSLEEAGLASEASALALSATAVILVVMMVLDRLHKRLPEGVIPWRV